MCSSDTKSFDEHLKQIALLPQKSLHSYGADRKNRPKYV